MDIDNLTSEDLAKIVKRYGSKTVVCCKYCKTIDSLPFVGHYTIGSNTYRSCCGDCGDVFPECCVQKNMYSNNYYFDHPECAPRKGWYGCKIYLCRSCIKKKKREKKEVECFCCCVSESYCEDVPFSQCKKCHNEVCEICILNCLCVCCHDDLGFNTDGLQVGDRVVYSGRGPILTEATVMKIYRPKAGRRQKIRILSNRGYEWNKPPKAIRVYRNYLRKI